MAEYVEIVLDQGTDFSYNVTLYDAQTNANSNIAGYIISSQMRKSYYTSTITANLTCTVISAEEGQFRISMSANTTANIASGRYLFDVKTYDSINNKTRRALEGYITVTPQITK